MEIPENYPNEFWHCHVELNSSGKKNPSAVFNDLTIQELWDQIVIPWHSGRPFTVDGMIVKDLKDVHKIKITHTPNSKRHYAEQHNASMRNSGIADMATDRRLLPLSQGKDYTHEFLFAETKTPVAPKTTGKPGKNVFIVHGHDEQAKESTARFIEKLGLNAIILHEQPNEGKTIIEKLEKHTEASFAVVLFTPDDVGAKSSDSSNLNTRARQNVLVELGYMAAKIGRDRVCVLRKGDVEMPSDLIGVLYIDIDSAGAWRLSLAKELKVAGLRVDLNEAI
ncbi:nucleotide-binding protein [Parahaliea sp. F7430]|uniref:Nucleotide-binding protein n=1 Tax=Sediminihaliea albiluteola TaxID=2758564 RepID=A0A7W2TXA5_9GAMM|nr:nucleotide-binding protein [Sediminihaliea albiluteola]MBA6413667.1 nucleotide-binding protein [Sediminihaliea albiluteola]